jgi:membrane protein YdbS with pleckstrin-like domain
MSIKYEPEITIPPDFQSTLDDNEKLLWADKPTLTPYILSNIWHNIIFLCFAGYIMLTMWAGHHNSTSGGADIFMYIVPAFILFMGGRGIIYAILSYSNTIYAYSQKRVIIRTGFIGIDYRTVDYDKISDVEVTVNIFEKMYNVGTVKFSSGARDSKGNLLYEAFTSVKNPYDVFKELKQVTVNVKTDYDYPNALRPKENPGYNTEYDPDNT